MEFIKWLNDNIFWGIPMIIVFLFVGIFFTIKLKFFQILKLPYIFKQTLFSKKKSTSDGKNLTPFQTLTASLATTLGTGNIVAVTAAIVFGGAGAVFWMWISAILGMATCYAETVLGMKYRQKDKDGSYKGGAFYYIKNGLKSPFLASAFALFCILASFGMGNMAQTNALSQSMKNSFNIPYFISGIIVVVILSLVIFGGITRLGKITEVIIPAFSLIYIGGCFMVIFVNFSEIPNCFAHIFREAFSLKSAGGGIIGSVMASSMAWGFKRGIFSNEAGLGSTVMMSVSTTETDPQKQGLWATVQVFIDTIIICTLTALVVLITNGGTRPISAEEAFGTAFGDFAGGFVALCIFIFAVSTVAGWSVFGSRCVEFLFGKKFIKLYLIIFVAASFIGCISNLELVWQLSDLFNSLMAVPNLFALIMLRKEIS